MQIQVKPILDATVAAIEACRLNQTGCYRRYADSSSMDCDPYGTADAANLLYIMGMFPRNPKQRAEWVNVLRGLQCPETGLYMDSTHHPFHTTAHCTAALELFEAAPQHVVKDFASLTEPERMYKFLDGLNWQSDPLRAGHQLGGLYTTLTLMEQVGPEWEQAFFNYMDLQIDPETGLIGNENVQPLEHEQEWSYFPHLSGHFHVLSCYIADRRAHPYSFRLIDTCLDIMEERSGLFLQEIGFAEINWILALTRSSRVCAHRFEEARAALVRFAPKYVDFLTEEAHAGNFKDLHNILGAVCALAELQVSVPGLIQSRRPMNQVMDRRPFL